MCASITAPCIDVQVPTDPPLTDGAAMRREAHAPKRDLGQERGLPPIADVVLRLAVDISAVGN